MDRIVAARDVAETAGYLIGSLVLPIGGLVVLTLGLVRRSRTRRVRSSPPNPGWPQYPSGFGTGPTPGPPGPGTWGWPPPPAPSPQWYEGPPPGQPRSAATGSSGTALIVVGAILIALGLLGAVGAATSRHARHDDASPSRSSAAPRSTSGGPDRSSGGGTRRPAGLAVGDCVTSAAFEGRDFQTTVDCARPDAVYELASSGDATRNCPDGKRDDTHYAAVASSEHTYCFLPNMHEGQCYSNEKTENATYAVRCSDPAASYRVDRRIDSATGSCAAGQTTIVYQAPPRRYCLLPP